MSEEMIDNLKKISERITAKQNHIELLENVIATVLVNLDKECTADDLRRWFADEHIVMKIKDSRSKF